MATKNCIKCSTDISNLHINCVRCTKCQKKHRDDRAKSFIERKKNRAKYGASKLFVELGTTDFSSHKRNNDEDEVKAVKKEMKKLGLRK